MLQHVLINEKTTLDPIVETDADFSNSHISHWYKNKVKNIIKYI